MRCIQSVLKCRILCITNLSHCFGKLLDSIRIGEDRELFAAAMRDIGLEVAASGFAHTPDEALATAEELGYPVVIRPSFTLGGAGGGIAHNADELRVIASQGLSLSPTTEVLVEQSAKNSLPTCEEVRKRYLRMVCSTAWSRADSLSSSSVSWMRESFFALE